jgi:hypothetical protein
MDLIEAHIHLRKAFDILFDEIFAKRRNRKRTPRDKLDKTIAVLLNDVNAQLYSRAFFSALRGSYHSVISVMGRGHEAVQWSKGVAASGNSARLLCLGRRPLQWKERSSLLRICTSMNKAPSSTAPKDAPPEGRLYRTPDQGLAATLHALGCPLREVEGHADRDSVFVFTWREDLDEAAAGYWTDQIVVSARVLIRALYEVQLMAETCRGDGRGPHAV